jgi:hypothetical protein
MKVLKEKSAAGSGQHSAAASIQHPLWDLLLLALYIYCNCNTVQTFLKSLCVAID